MESQESQREARLPENSGKRIIKLSVVPVWYVRQDMGEKNQ